MLLLFARAASADQSPILTTPLLVEAAEQDSIRFTVSASDPDGDLITGLGVLQLPTGALFSVDLGASRGTFRWRPDYSSAGSYPLSFYAENSIRSYGYTLLQINNTDRPPVITVPPSVPGVEGQALEFTASVTDLDGDSFLSLVAEALPEGAQFTPNPSQSFARITWTPQPGQGGSYKVRLISTTRPLLSPPGVDTAAVTITVSGGQFSPRVFAQEDEKTVLLGPGTGQVCIHIEPRGTFFDPSLIVPSTIELVWPPGLRLAADEVDLNQEDADGNRVKDVTACFSRNDLKNLLANEDLPKTSRVTVRGNLVGGGTFSGAVDLNPVLARNTQVFLTPNPSHGNGVLSFYTSDTGWTQLRIFDARGRLLQTLVDERYMRAGFHNVRLDGGSSKQLPTGMYFYKLDTVNASLKGRFLVVK
ncbi:MAG TPA: T9SS type A sorting domain-containing protein [Candidatus Eisenbacteria bacterium]|nr:T9SS type A sorting domain-containing protein [Candidatus Eisenbacteria bacterium]